MKNAHQSRLRGILSEVSTKGYFARAQQRAARRKSAWNLLDLLVGFPCVALVGWTVLHLVWATRNALLPQHAAALSAMFQSQRYQVAHVVLLISVLFTSIPIGMLISNVIVWSVPPYRRATEPEAKGIWHASFADAQKDLSLVALVLGLPLLAVSFIAAIVMRDLQPTW
jgi:hypothetical protein